MSKRVFLLGLGLTLVALALAVTDWLLTPPPTPGVTEANVKRLRLGMTLEEVESMLGRLPAWSFGHSGFGWPEVGSFATLQRKAMLQKYKLTDSIGAVFIYSAEPPGPTRELLRMLYRDGPPFTAPGADGTAILYPRADGRLKRAEWEPNPGATPTMTGLIGRLRGWLGW
jgi:hypothetical protein